MHPNATNYGLYVADRFTNTGTVTGGGGILFGGGGYFNNYGTAIGTTANGVRLIGGSTDVYNAGSGVIVGQSSGLYSTDSASILNSGRIAGYQNQGVDIRANAYLDNRYGVVTGGSIGVYFSQGVVVNAGGIIAGIQGNGVSIGNDGKVFNTALGSITGGAIGVSVDSGQGNVYNSGYIGGGSGTNPGAGVVLGNATGGVSNAGSGYIYGSTNGVVVTGNVGSSQVENAGYIEGRHGSGVLVEGTATYTAVYVDNTATGTISGSYGITGDGNVLVTNAGHITGVYGMGVDISGSVVVDNLAGGVIQGTVAGVSLYGTNSQVDNYGTIVSANNGVVFGAYDALLNVGGDISGSDGVGVVLGAGGPVQNTPAGGQGGFIYGRYYGILSGGTRSATITNSGQIEGGFTGVDLRVGGQLANNGGLVQGLRDAGVSLEGGGSVSNTINAGQRGDIIGATDGVRGSGSSIQVTNSADISGTQVGVDLLAGGTVTNLAGGRITGAIGVLVSGGNATVTDAGTISGSAYAVEFTGGRTDRLILDPGAVLSGKVSGAGAHSTLELAAGNGTLSGLGSQFAGFEQVVVDQKANWTLTKANSLATGSTLTVGGTLTVAGSLVDSGSATIAGTLRTSGTGAVRLTHGRQ